MSDEKKDAKPVETVPEKVAEPAKSFWLVIVRDEADTPPQCIRCENAESLTRAIEENVLGAVTPLHAFAFEGWRIPLSSPRPVCSIKTASGEKIDVGRSCAEYDEGGRILPLRKPATGE